MTTYTFSHVDDPHHGTALRSGINDVGQIVGHYSDSSGATHGFLYSGGSYTTLDDPSGIGSTVAYGINDAGGIVGQYIDSKSILHSFFTYNFGTITGYFRVTIDITYATVWHQRRGDSSETTRTATTRRTPSYIQRHYIVLSDPFGFNGTFAYGINNAGQSVGYYLDPNNTAHGFLYSGGTYTTIDDPLGTNGTFAYGINDLGQIVGTYIDSNSKPHGFLYSGGTYTTVDDPLGTYGTTAFGINDAGPDRRAIH